MDFLFKCPTSLCNQPKEKTEKQIIQATNRIKILENKETYIKRKERSHRLIVRGAIFESLVANAKELTEAEVTALLSTALSTTEAKSCLEKIREATDRENP